VALVLLGSLLAFLAVVLLPPIPPLPELPTPNAFPELVAAGVSIGQKDLFVPTGPADDEEALRAWVASNKDALSRARKALEHESGVPFVGDTNTIVNQSVQSAGPLRDLGRLFLAEAKLARLEGRTDDALAATLDALRLAGKAGRGGMLIDDLVGIAIESQAIEALTDLVGDLDDRQFAVAMMAIEELEGRREPGDEVIRRERALYLRRGDLAVRVMMTAAPGLTTKLRKPPEDAARFAIDRASARARLLLTEMALRRYESAHGKAPERLADLVPDFLPSVPLDPFANQTLTYHQVEGGHLLYSLGPDGVDDRGTPVSDRGMTKQSRGDLLLPGQAPRAGP
jgi:hypothetical protein